MDHNQKKGARQMSELKFKATDFYSVSMAPPGTTSQYCPATWQCERLAEFCNEKLAEMLAACPAVFKCAGFGHYDTWAENKSELDVSPSHTAKLVDIRPIEKGEGT